MSARHEEAYSVDLVHKNVLTERADIINYVPTVGVFLYRTRVNYALCIVNYELKSAADYELCIVNYELIKVFSRLRRSPVC